MAVIPEYRQERPKRNSIFIGLGAGWVVLMVLGFPLTILSPLLPVSNAVIWGFVVSAAVVAGIFAARVQHRG